MPSCGVCIATVFLSKALGWCIVKLFIVIDGFWDVRKRAIEEKIGCINTITLVYPGSPYRIVLTESDRGLQVRSLVIQGPLVIHCRNTFKHAKTFPRFLR